MKILNQLFYLFLILLIGSCSPIYYVPNSLNTPLFSSKGEFKAKIATGTNAFEPQLAFAIADHIALMANGSFSYADSSSKSLKRNFLEGAIGYYTTIEEPGVIFETYAGYGKGSIYGNYSFLDDKTNAWYNRFFIQPNIGIRSKYFEISVGARFAALNIHKTYPDRISSGYNYFFEPAASLRIGPPRFKLDLQFGFSGNLKGADLDLFPHNPVIVSLGFQLTLGGKKFEEY